VLPTKGQVCTQNPAAGTQIEENRPVSFTTYAGPANVQVPSVTGSTYESAATAIRAAGLVPQRVDVNSSQAAGQVLDQDPKAFQMVAPGSPIKLQVADGKVKLPDVTHLAYAEAKSKLNTLGFTTVQSTDADVQAPFKVGQVMAVDPTPGIWYDKSTTITLTVAIPKKLPPCTTPSTSPSTSASATGTASPSTSKSPSAPASPTCVP
jgi:serine/threonine-protein kinase